MTALDMLRPLDPGETFFHLSDQVSCMNFAVFAERDGLLSTDRLRIKLDALQSANRLLQARIDWLDGQLVFAQAPGQRIDLQCRQVNAADWQNCVTQLLQQPFAEGVAPLMRCLYLEISPVAGEIVSASASSVLVLCFHHAVADGRSGMAMLRQLMSSIAHDAPMTPAMVGATAPAPMQSLMPTAYRWHEQPESAQRLKSAIVADYRRHGALTELPWHSRQADRCEHRFTRLTFDATTTTRLVNVARSRGCTVHGALCAAQLLAQFELQSTLAPQTLLLSCPVDMRPHLQPVPPQTPTGLYVSILSSTFGVDSGTSLWSLAAQVSEQIHTQLARGEAHFFFNLYGLGNASITSQDVVPFQKKLLSSLPNTMVSNVGVVDPVAADPGVRSMSFVLFPMPYQTLFTAASTYAGQLQLNIGFDAARLDPHDAQTLADAMRRHLQQAA